MSPRRKRVTAGSMIGRGGLTKFAQAVRFAARYSEACDGLGRLCTLEEYRLFRGMSSAQVFREQKAWRDCVGPELSVLEVISEAALKKKGWTEEQREAAIGRWLSGG